MLKITRLIRDEYAKLAVSDRGIAEAVATCLALIAGKVAQYNSSCCRWKPTGETLVDMFGRQAIPMVWDFAEAYPFSGSTGDFAQYADSFCTTLEQLASIGLLSGTVQQVSATRHSLPDNIADALVTDPPYYDAIPYADLSDFFYVWLRRSLSTVHPQLFASGLSPKEDEAVTLAHRAAMYRHKDRRFFEEMMKSALTQARRYIKDSGAAVVVFANKSTSGWEAMLAALVDSGWAVSASWPIDTEMASRLRAQDSAVLASSVHLVCRPRPKDETSVGDWRDVLHELPPRIHDWMPRLPQEGVVGADAIFACLGPALEIYSRYSHVEKASGEIVALKEYLEQVWSAVAKEALAMVFTGADASGFEADARLTAMWLWTLQGLDGNAPSETGQSDSEDDSESEKRVGKASGFTLEYDAARKIAQGLGAELEAMGQVVQVTADQARLLGVAERTAHLFGKEEQEAIPASRRKRRAAQMDMFADLTESEDTEAAWREKTAKRVGETTLDRVHQAMILFGAGRGEALKRFVIEDGVGRDGKFWRLAQALSALYPSNSDEKRWVDGLLARKKQFGF